MSPQVLVQGEAVGDCIGRYPFTPGAGWKCSMAAGGAPINAAVGLARLGVPTGVLACLGTDPVGKAILALLQQEGIDVAGVVTDPRAQTRMAFVTSSPANRLMLGFTNAASDERLSPRHIRPDLFAGASLLLLGSSLFLPSKSATQAAYRAVELARQHGLLVMWDLNIREAVWRKSREAYRRAVRDTLEGCRPDVVKMSQEDLEFLTGSADSLEVAVGRLQQEYGVPLLVVTLGEAGAYFATASSRQHVPGYKVRVLETTGAGDGFNAGMILKLLPHLQPEQDPRAILLGLAPEQVTDAVTYGCAMGALACTKFGAIPAMPTLAEVSAFLAQSPYAGS